jgi:hypothetical protein
MWNFVRLKAFACQNPSRINAAFPFPGNMHGRARNLRRFALHFPDFDVAMHLNNVLGMSRNGVAGSGPESQHGWHDPTQPNNQKRGRAWPSFIVLRGNLTRRSTVTLSPLDQHAHALARVSNVAV